MGIEFNPEDPQLHAMAGSLHVALKQESEAEAALQQALELDADNFSALVNLAKLRIQHRDFERARELVDRLMEIAGQRLSIMTLKSYVALVLDDYDTADRWSRQVLAHDGENPTALYVSGAAAFALNQLERAHSHLTRYLKFAPDDTNARSMLSEAKALLASDTGDQAASPGARFSYVSLAALDAGETHASRRTIKAMAAPPPDTPARHAPFRVARTTDA